MTQRFPKGSFRAKYSNILKTLQGCLERLRASGVFGDLEWASVATSESGSYNADAVLSFLETHLELWCEGRRVVMDTNC